MEKNSFPDELPIQHGYVLLKAVAKLEGLSHHTQKLSCIAVPVTTAHNMPYETTKTPFQNTDSFGVE